MFKKATNFLKRTAKKAITSERLKTMALMLVVGTGIAMAQNSAGDYSAGTTALTTVTEEIAKYVPIVVKLCYAIAGVVAVVGAISVYIAMNNEEQDVKKKIMMIVGACIFLVAAAQALPLLTKLKDEWQVKSRKSATPITHYSRGYKSLLSSWGFKGAISIGLQELSVEPLSASS